MKLNHLNLAVGNVTATQMFMQKYFEFRAISEGNDKIAILLGEDDFVLTLMQSRGEAEVEYPSSFHLGLFRKAKRRSTRSIRN